MNRFKSLLESDLQPTEVLQEKSKSKKILVKIPLSNYSDKGDLAFAYAKRDTKTAIEIATKKLKVLSVNLTANFVRLTRKEVHFEVMEVT